MSAKTKVIHTYKEIKATYSTNEESVYLSAYLIKSNGLHKGLSLQMGQSGTIGNGSG